MSASVNEVTLLGRLGKDPEVRYTQSGAAVANFSVATDETYKDRSGEKQKKTEWHNIVVWGDTVTNFVEPYLHKGDLVYIRGKLQTRSWEDKEGQKKYTTEVVVLDIKGVQTGDRATQTSAAAPATRNSTRGNTSQQRSAAQPRGGSASRGGYNAGRAAAAQTAPESNDEDIPF